MVLNLLRIKEVLCGISFQVINRPLYIVLLLAKWIMKSCKANGLLAAIYLVDSIANVCISIIIISLGNMYCVPNQCL